MPDFCLVNKVMVGASTQWEEIPNTRKTLPTKKDGDYDYTITPSVAADGLAMCMPQDDHLGPIAIVKRFDERTTVSNIPVHFTPA